MCKLDFESVIVILRIWFGLPKDEGKTHCEHWKYYPPTACTSHVSYRGFSLPIHGHVPRVAHKSQKTSPRKQGFWQWRRCVGEKLVYKNLLLIPCRIFWGAARVCSITNNEAISDQTPAIPSTIRKSPASGSGPRSSEQRLTILGMKEWCEGKVYLVKHLGNPLVIKMRCGTTL